MLDNIEIKDNVEASENLDLSEAKFFIERKNISDISGENNFFVEDFSHLSKIGKSIDAINISALKKFGVNKINVLSFEKEYFEKHNIKELEKKVLDLVYNNDLSLGILKYKRKLSEYAKNFFNFF